MRKIVLNLAMSLDGYIEGPNGEFDWCFTDQDYGMNDFLNSADAIFLGRKSYETLITAGLELFAALKIYIFSNTLTTVDVGAEIINSDTFIQRVQEIRNMPGGHIWLFGGAELVSTFMAERLINEIVLSVHPVVLGGGKPLFIGKNRTDLMLLGTEQFSSGLVQLRYTFKPNFDYSMIDF